MDYVAVGGQLGEEVFLAGHRVAPGTYVEVESRREIRLAQEDDLPASLDGRVAAYVRKPATWRSVASGPPEKPEFSVIFELRGSPNTFRPGDRPIRAGRGRDRESDQSDGGSQRGT